jgi:nitrogen-specific signal transduction histidine kinase
MRKLKIYKDQPDNLELKSDDILFQAIFNESPEAIFLLDGTDFRITECNLKAIELFQADAKINLINLESFKLYESEPAGFSKEMIIKEIGRGAEYRQELALKTLKGDIFWGSISKKRVQLNGEAVIILRVKQVIDYIQAAETLATLIKSTAKLTGELFLKKLTGLLASTFEAKYCYIAKVSDAVRHQAETIKFWSNKLEGKNFVFNYDITPCANVLKGYITFYPRNLQEMFPEDQLIASMGIESFIGAPIYNNSENPMGMLVLMDDKPMKEKPNSRYILSIFASRAGAELERLYAEELLRKQTHELIELNAMKDRFLKITAHDLKNPFNSIMGFSELLREKIKDYDRNKIREMVNIIDDSVKYSCTILENLSAWSRLHRDVLNFYPEKIDIKEIIEHNIKYFINYARRKTISITGNARKGIYAFADTSMLDTVIKNLLSNSIKFTGKNGQISINALKKEGNIEITVTDNGAGMSKKLIREIMSGATIMPSACSGNKSANGLGLAVCREFVKKNDGLLHIESESGKGTSVSFTLPALKD